MFKDKEKLYQIYHTILSMALTWALTLVINQYYGLKVPIAICAIFSVLSAIGIYLFDLNRKNTLSYVILASIIPILALIFVIRKVNPFHWVVNFLDWCGVYDGSEKLYHVSYAHFVILFVALAAEIVLYLLMKKQAAKFILSVILFLALMILSIKKIDSNKEVVGICLFYLLSIIIELYGIIYSRKVGRQEKREGILYLAPICLLLSVLAVSMPSKPEPIQWTSFKNMYYNVKNQMEIWRTDLDYYMGRGEAIFHVSYSGYSDNNGDLGSGKIKDDNKIALKLSGSKEDNPVYLIGSVSDVYTGSSWEKSRNDFKSKEPEYLLDYLELATALSRIDQNTLEKNQFIETGFFKLEYHDIKTKTFFYPIKSSSFDNLHGVSNPNYDTSNIIFRKAAGNGTTYQYQFYELNLQGDAFQKMLRDADTFTYKDSSNVRKDKLEWVENNILNNDNMETSLSGWNYDKTLKERAESIKKQYTVLPDRLPPRVRELAKRITEKYNNNYDRLKAIEAFLRNYNYTTNPGNTPKDRDFVDYFLFDSKKGYCTSYATAMAVLGRCIGIPTRYVEGYLATFDQNDNTEMFLVKNTQAHAWAEAYLEGVGWIPFEATQPFYKKRYTKWKEISKVEDKDTYDISNQMYKDYMNQTMGNNQQDNSNEVELKKGTGLVNGLIIFLSTIIVMILLLGVYYQLLKMKYKKEFDRANYNKKMYLTFLKILSLLKREGFVLNPQDTILMLALQINNRFLYEKVTFPMVAEIFMKNRYGEEEISKVDFEKVAVFYQGLDSRRRDELSRTRILLEDFIFLTKKSNH